MPQHVIEHAGAPGLLRMLARWLPGACAAGAGTALVLGGCAFLLALAAGG